MCESGLVGKQTCKSTSATSSNRSFREGIWRVVFVNNMFVVGAEFFPMLCYVMLWVVQKKKKKKKNENVWSCWNSELRKKFQLFVWPSLWWRGKRMVVSELGGQVGCFIQHAGSYQFILTNNGCVFRTTDIDIHVHSWFLSCYFTLWSN